MDDVGIVEAAQHMRDGIDLADVGEELVPEALALRGAPHQAGDVHELQCRVGGLPRLVERRQPLHPVVGDGHHAHVRILGRERIVGRQHRRAGESVEEGALAHVGQADDADRKTHGACHLHQ